jgi:hypothetical protein
VRSLTLKLNGGAKTVKIMKSGCGNGIIETNTIATKTITMNDFIEMWNKARQREIGYAGIVARYEVLMQHVVDAGLIESATMHSHFAQRLEDLKNQTKKINNETQPNS